MDTEGPLPLIPRRPQQPGASMTRFASLTCALLLAACATTPTVKNDPITLTLATATPGGGFPVYGDAFKGAVQEADPTITIDTRNTKGSAENVPLLEESRMDLALVQGE